MSHALATAATSALQAGTAKKAVNIILVGIAGFIAYRIGKSIYSKYRKNDAQHRAADDPHVRLAMGLNAAMNPSGISWMRSFDTTNLSKMYEYAEQVTSWNAVQNAYKDLYQRNLMDDVQKELNNSEYQRFMTLITSNNSLIQQSEAGKTPSAPVKFAHTGELIVAKTNLNVRSSPIGSYNGGIHEVLEKNKNIVRSVKKGDFIGYATGRQEFDVKNNIKFIEVGFRLSSNLPVTLKPQFAHWQGKEVRQWVSSSTTYVDKFSSQQAAEQAYPNLKHILSYLLPPSTTLKGLEGRKPTLLTVAQATVLDERMQPIATVAPNTILGECAMVLRLNDGSCLVKFRTVQGTERWTSDKHVKIIAL